ncbi:MAG: amidase [Proteobacteria bacterium]|nr:amidase [Pseudomonadota bacterium]
MSAAFAEYESYDALGLAELIRRREVGAEEVLEAAIARVEALNPRLNAVVMRLYDLARAALAAGVPEGPLAGVPYLLKDISSHLAGTPTTRASRFFAEALAAEDSEHVRRLKRAGLVIFGKTNTCELGLSVTCEPRFYGPTRNPWDEGRTSGGSSGGAAAAVAAGMVPAAHATDGFGSIRVPAACCGLVGLKPSRGRNTFAPYLGEGAGGISAEHAVTRSVRDCAALLDAVAGPGEGDPYVAPAPARPYREEVGADPGRLSIAFTRGAPSRRSVAPECVRLVEETARLLAGLGHRVEEADPPIDGPAAWATFATIMAANTVVNLSRHPREGRPARADEVERVTWATKELGERVSGADYLRATQAAHKLGRDMARFHRAHDLLLTPALASPPVKLGWLDMMMDDVRAYWDRIEAFTPFSVWFNLTGQPAMVLPLGETENGLPLAVQLVARYGDEAALFRVAAQLEVAKPWRDRRPARSPRRGSVS